MKSWLDIEEAQLLTRNSPEISYRVVHTIDKIRPETVDRYFSIEMHCLKGAKLGYIRAVSKAKFS